MEGNYKGLACFTIGHSTHDSAKFINLLKLHFIQWIIDVRSTPYSKHNPQFNKELIKSELKKEGIPYFFMGNLLGARYNNPKLYFPDKPVIDYRKVRERDSFKQGIERITDGLRQGYNICLMCAEKDPFNCHRFVLVSYSLSRMGVNVKHILDNGEIIRNEALEDKMISKYKLDSKQQSLFEKPKTKSALIEEAYVLRNKDIGVSKL